MDRLFNFQAMPCCACRKFYLIAGQYEDLKRFNVAKITLPFTPVHKLLPDWATNTTRGPVTNETLICRMDPNTTLANADLVLDGTNVTLNFEPFFHQGADVFAPVPDFNDDGDAAGNSTEEPTFFDSWWTPHTVPALIMLPFIPVLLIKNLEVFTRFNSLGETAKLGFLQLNRAVGVT